MFPLVVCTFFIGILASLHMLLPDVSKIRTEAIDDSVAATFCLYRTAVTQYLENSEHVQVIPNASLDLPPGYVYLRQWQARIIGDYCYVYGTTEYDQPWLIRKKLGNSLLVGENRSGRLYPSGVAVPATIPTGTIVSIVSAQ